jgi:hypothetical protein
MESQHKILERKVLIRIRHTLCETPEELISSELFMEVLKHAVKKLQKTKSVLLNIFDKKEITESDIELVRNTLLFLFKIELKLIPNIVKGSEVFFKNSDLFSEFIEFLYNYWRSFDRFVICDSAEDYLNKRPYRTFNETIEKLTHIVRKTYRDIQENITGKHQQIYRQVRAGAEIATIAMPKDHKFFKGDYKVLSDIPIIRQVLINPPLILNPPMNKRTGKNEKINSNPLNAINLNKNEWLCYPAKVGPYIMFVYFHEKFYELGFSLCNLFDIADESELDQKPDAVFFYGTNEDLKGLGTCSTVFYEDDKNDVLVAAIPNKDEFGYFGYLKKMILTLHNAKVIKNKRMPFHGAMLQIKLKNEYKTLLFMGDTGAGKSETIEAFRTLAEEYIENLDIIADDMGSMDIGKNGEILGYGTEIGAFLRLDDLQPGYAYGQMDRAIFMNANQVNARIVIPVTTFKKTMIGSKVDYIFYANNYEQVDDDHPIIEKFKNAEDAIKVFRDGTVMSKGTTTSTGLVHSYFANVFGPVQYKDLHEDIAKRFFDQFFKAGVYVGQFRTRLGIAGYEMNGPKEAAKYLLELLTK